MGNTYGDYAVSCIVMSGSGGCRRLLLACGEGSPFDLQAAKNSFYFCGFLL